MSATRLAGERGAAVRATMELVPIGLAQLDLDGRFLLANKHFCVVLGCSSDEVRKQTIQEITSPGDRPALSALIDELVQGNAERRAQIQRFLRPDGSEVWTRVALSVVRNEGGQPELLLATAEDISDRKRFEEKLRLSEERLRALIEASPLGIDVMDLEGNPIFYNPRCEELHGIRLADAGTGGWIQAVHPDDRQRVEASWHEAASARRPWAAAYRFLHADGRVVWVSGRAAPMEIDGEFVGFVGTLEDITAERIARTEAENAAKQRDEALAIVAHDLRNSIGAIGMSAALLKGAAPDDSQVVRRVDVIERGVARMTRLVRDLLDVNRIESGTFAVHHGQVDVGALLEQAKELFGPQSIERQITITCNVEPDVPPVDGDGDRLLQLLSNLVGNALKFTDPGGRIQLLARRVDAGVQISVEDSGKGIPAASLPHIFDRFWQGDRASRRGAGLGLAIVKGIVGAHGGRIWVESAVGRGSTFHIILPPASLKA